MTWKLITNNRIYCPQNHTYQQPTHCHNCPHNNTQYPIPTPAIKCNHPNTKQNYKGTAGSISRRENTKKRRKQKT